MTEMGTIFSFFSMSGFHRSVVRDAFDSAVEQFQGSRRSRVVCIVESQRKRLADVQLGQKREVLVANG